MENSQYIHFMNSSTISTTSSTDSFMDLINDNIADDETTNISPTNNQYINSIYSLYTKTKDIFTYIYNKLLIIFN